MLKGARTVRGLCAVAVTALALGAAACGGDDSSDSSSSSGGGGSAEPATTQTGTPMPSESSSLQLTAVEKGGLKFDKKELEAKAGEVTITMENPKDDSMPHDIAIEGNGVNQSGEIVQPGGTSTVKADLKPGTYTFYCSVGSHRQAGMEGTLTVK
jgi:plastocyanin